MNPFFFPYNFNLFAPLLATLVPGVGLLVARFDASRRAAVLAVVLTCLTGAAEGFPALAKVVVRNNTAQKRVVEWIWRATAPDEHVFDWQGISLFRPGIFHWWIFSGLAPRYDTGTWYSVADELQRYRVTLIVWNYRIGWLNAPDSAYVASHYVPIDTCLLAPGHVFRAADFAYGDAEFEPPVRGTYRIDGAVPGLLIDGAPSGGAVQLSKEKHRIGFENGATPPAAFALVYSTPLRDHAGRPCPANQPLLQGFS